MVHSVEFSNSVTTLALNYVKNIIGLGLAPVDIESMQSYRQDGSTVQSVTYQARPFTIDFDIRGSNAMAAELERKAVLNFFGEKGAKTFRYGRNGKQYYLFPVYMAAPFDPDIREFLSQSGSAQFLASNPYFKRDIPLNSVQTETALLEVSGTGMEIPTAGIEFASAENRIVVACGGSNVSPVIIRFVGPAITPFVHNITTDERIEVNRSVAAGEILIINTETYRVDVIDSSGISHNAFNYILDGSDFLHFNPGDNIIEFGSAGGSGYIEVGGLEYYAGV